MEIEEIKRIHQECIPRSPKGLTDPRTARQVIGVWFPEPLAKILTAEAEAPETVKTRIAAIKYFTPDGAGTWYFSEYNPKDRLFYGLCKIQEAEYGYVDFDELREVKGHLGLYVERDFYFTPCPMTEAGNQ